MKKYFMILVVLNLLFTTINLSAQVAHSEIIDELCWDELSNLLDKRYNDVTENGNTKIMLFIYIEYDNDKTSVYSNFLSEKDQLINTPPSLIIRTKGNVVIPVYFGIEKRIKRSVNYIRKVKELADHYLYPIKNVVSLNTPTWCWQFEKGKLKKSYEGFNNKNDKIPAWIYRQ